MFRLFGAQSDKDEGNYSTTRGRRTWRVLTQVIVGDWSSFSQRAVRSAQLVCGADEVGDARV